MHPPLANPAVTSAVLRVRFFGPVRARLGRDAADLPWPDEKSIAEFWLRFFTVFPELAAMRDTLRLARDHEFLLGTERLRPGDEIALIPPVSGG